MKTTFFLLPAALLVVCSSWISPSVSKEAPEKAAQEQVTNQTTAFAFFRTHRQGKGITATWAMTSASGVTGFAIQRTYEDPNDPYAFWEDLGSLACTSNRSFSYSDDLVFPGIINYRVVAVMADGTSVASEVSSVRIVSRK